MVKSSDNRKAENIFIGTPEKFLNIANCSVKPLKRKRNLLPQNVSENERGYNGGIRFHDEFRSVDA